MKNIALALALVFAAPAFATGGFTCETTNGPKIYIGATTGRVIGSPIVSDLYVVKSTVSSTINSNQVVQYWSDAKNFNLLVIDEEAMFKMYLVETRCNADTYSCTGTLKSQTSYDSAVLTQKVRCDME